MGVLTAAAENMIAGERAKETREYSTIAFPYVALDEAATVARALTQLGGQPVDRDQLAAHMGQNVTSGNFNSKIGAAKMFGLVDPAQGKLKLTPLGFAIVDPTREREAKAEAFLQVPLYRRMYDAFKGKQLPPRPLGIENAFVEFGVSVKQREKARWAFDRSARVANYFPNGQEDRLVAPVIMPSELNQPSSLAAVDRQDVFIQPEPMQQVGARVGNVTNFVPEPAPINPFVEGLLKKLPEEGTEWTLEGRKRWLEAASHIFNLVYEGNEADRLLEIRIIEL